MNASPRERFAFSDAGGTPEAHWQSWFDAGHASRPLDLGAARRVVVVGAHPDDEVLGAGGTMSALVRRGVPVTIVCMSDGAGSHPGSPTVSPADLAERRHDELLRAAAVLGVDDVRWVGLPDGGLQQAMPRLVDVLGEVVTETAGEAPVILTVWNRDGHPDHEAVGDAAKAVAADVGARLLSYPIWMWHWAVPDDPIVPWERIRVHELSADESRAKCAAIEEFASQIRPLSHHPADRAVLPPELLTRFTRPGERLIV